MARIDQGTCENCGLTFVYYLIHNGFNNSWYAYCDGCGMTSILDLYHAKIPNPLPCPPHGPICEAVEPLLLPCTCGGRFRVGAAPRCSHFWVTLSPVAAASYIEANAPAGKTGWRWQRSWSGLFCILVDNRAVYDNFV